jgi:hypothetical protein
MIISGIPVLIVALTPQLNVFLIISSVFLLLLNGYYAFLFQIKLIKKVVGQIKNRMKMFLVGEIISFSASFFALLVGLEILNESISMIFYIIGIVILVFGFSIIFVFSINFPPFYEFEWPENLLQFYILDPNSNDLLYSYNFQENFGIGQENQELIISQGLSGINSLISSITGSKKEMIKEIKQDEFNILIYNSVTQSELTYILLVKKHLKSFSHILTEIKTSFENYYQIVLSNYPKIHGDKKRIFREFDVYLDNLSKII